MSSLLLSWIFFKFLAFSRPALVVAFLQIQQRERERERESLLAQILNNFIPIKAKALGHRKKPVKQVVSSGAPRQFHKFLLWCKFDGRIYCKFVEVIVLKRLRSAGWSTQLRGSAGSQPVSIVVCSVPQGAERGRESVNPAIMKLCPGFHNPFPSKQTIVAL